MKKTMLCLLCILTALLLFLPIGKILCALFGYTFKLLNPSAFAVIVAIVSAFTAVIGGVFFDTVKGKAVTVVSSALLPLSIINGVLCVILYGGITVTVGALICTGCCCFQTVMQRGQNAFKTVFLALSALALLPIVLVILVRLSLGGLSLAADTVERSVHSENGEYTAHVISSDQGALGGSTFVDVYEKPVIDAVLFKVEKKPCRVYSGRWGEFENMQIYWEDNNCLVINSKKYEIEKLFS